MWHFYVTMRVLEHMTIQQALLLRFLSSYYLSILPKKKAFSLQKAWHSHCIQMNTYYFAGIFQFDIAKVFTFILLAAVNLSMYLLTMYRTNAAIGNNRWIGCGKRQLSRKKNVYWIFPLWGLMPISYIYIGFHMVYILKSNATLLHVVSTWVSSYIDRIFHDKRYV